MSQEIQAMFSRIAATYDRANRVISLGRDRTWRQRAVSLLARDGFTPERVLDVCAGTGDFALALKERFPEATVGLLDCSEPMLGLAREKLKGRASVSFTMGDTLNLPFPSMAFDTLLCGFGWRNLDGLVQGLEEMARVVRPDGRVCILDVFQPARPCSRILFHSLVTWVVPIMGGMVSGNPRAYRHLTKSAEGFLSAKEAVALMQRAGFTAIRQQRFMFGVVTALVAVRIELKNWGPTPPE